MDPRPRFDTPEVPVTPRAEARSRSPIFRTPPARSSDESGDAEELLTVSDYEYFDIHSCRYHRLLLRQDGKVRMLSYCGYVRDSTWHGWWNESSLGHLDVHVSYRGIDLKLININPPPTAGAGLRAVFCEGQLKAIVSKVPTTPVEC